MLPSRLFQAFAIIGNDVFYATMAAMTILAAPSPAMALPHSTIHPVLRTAMQETGRLCALVAGYGALIALFVLAAISLWGHLPSAVANANLVPGVSGTESPIKLRGSL